MNKFYVKGAVIASAIMAGFAAVQAFAAESLFVIPTSTVPDTMATVSATVQDPGLLLVIEAAVALSLVFWLAHGIIGLFARRRAAKA